MFPRVCSCSCRKQAKSCQFVRFHGHGKMSAMKVTRLPQPELYTRQPHAPSVSGRQTEARKWLRPHRHEPANCRGRGPVSAALAPSQQVRLRYLTIIKCRKKSPCSYNEPSPPSPTNGGGSRSIPTAAHSDGTAPRHLYRCLPDSHTQSFLCRVRPCGDLTPGAACIGAGGGAAR